MGTSLHQLRPQFAQQFAQTQTVFNDECVWTSRLAANVHPSICHHKSRSTGNGRGSLRGKAMASRALSPRPRVATTGQNARTFIPPMGGVFTQRLRGRHNQHTLHWRVAAGGGKRMINGLAKNAWKGGKDSIHLRSFVKLKTWRSNGKFCSHHNDDDVNCVCASTSWIPFLPAERCYCGAHSSAALW